VGDNVGRIKEVPLKAEFGKKSSIFSFYPLVICCSAMMVLTTFLIFPLPCPSGSLAHVHHSFITLYTNPPFSGNLGPIYLSQPFPTLPGNL